MKQTFMRHAAFAAMVTVASTAHADNEPIQLPLVQDVPVSQGYEGRGHDILGIRFGDTRADAIAKLKAMFPNSKIEEQSYAPGITDQNGNRVNFNYLSQVYVYGEGDPEEFIALNFTTDATGGRVYAINRRVTYSNDKLGSMQELKASIEAKYGKPTLVEKYSDYEDITYTWEKDKAAASECVMAATFSAYSKGGREPDEYEFRDPQNGRKRAFPCALTWPL